MSDFAAWVLSALNSVLAWVGGLIAPIFDSLWRMVADFVFFTFDKLFDLVIYIVSGMSWDFGAFNPLQYWNALPATLISTLNLIGVPAALAMIVAALAIRFVIQMIPFVRWGS